jgi:hypothetical protein
MFTSMPSQLSSRPLSALCSDRSNTVPLQQDNLVNALLSSSPRLLRSPRYPVVNRANGNYNAASTSARGLVILELASL